MQLRPLRLGGFLRPFRTTWFILEFLKGNGPADSRTIDPQLGVPITEIKYEYKIALLRHLADDIATREEESLARREGRRIDPERIDERRAFYRERLALTSRGTRQASFTRYFGLLKQLGWVEFTGEEAPSAPQENDPRFSPKRLYRLAAGGWAATPADISDPIMTLYAYPKQKRSKKEKSYVYPRRSKKEKGG